MKKKRLRKSERIALRLAVCLRHANRAEDSIDCNRMRSVGHEFTRTELDQLQEASSKLWEAKKIVKNVFAKIIGDHVVAEAELGELE